MRGDQKTQLSCTCAHRGCERMTGLREVRVILIFVILFVCILNFAWAEPLWSQGPPPPPAPRGRPDPPRLDARAIDDHVQNVRRHLEEIKPKDQDCEMLIAVARRDLDKAEEREHANDLFIADRLVAASDAFIHAAEHPPHLEEKGPKARPHPPRWQIRNRKSPATCVFSLTTGGLFSHEHSATRRAKQLPDLARRFTKSRLQAYDKNDWFGSRRVCEV